jgi:hypothetical protein
VQNIKPSPTAESSRNSRKSSFAVRILDALVSVRERLMPAFLKKARDEFRANGFRGLFKRYGWKVFVIFFCYYLIRDSILYILLPYLIAKGLF